MIITAIKAEIEVEAGWAVGTSGLETTGIDRELLTEPDGRPWVPPSSLAGSLRAHLARHGADQRLMGRRRPLDETGALAATPAPYFPSALWLLGTRARRSGSGASSGGEAPAPRTEVVVNTAFDPRRRAVAPQSMRYSRLVDEPAVIELYAMLDGELTGQDQELLATWAPEVGRDRTKGGGLARLRSLGFRRYDLDQPADLRAWLESAGRDRFKDLTPIPVAVGPDLPLLEAEFIIVTALHVGTAARRGWTAVTRRRGTSPLVPASTWKGLFRGRAGYVMRSCWGEEAACVERQACGQCPLCDLFGSKARRGRIGFRDSAVTQPRAEDRTHVAIDRISGGSRDKLLFTEEVVTSGRVGLRVLALGPVEDWERNLLLHVVADIHDGLIGIGSDTQRGQGTLRLADASHAALTALAPIPSRPPAAGATT